jgi:hypothetical protein
MAGRSRTNPQIKARVDVHLARVQRVLGELTSYGSGEPDRSDAIAMWDQIEKLRLRLRGGRR